MIEISWEGGARCLGRGYSVYNDGILVMLFAITFGKLLLHAGLFQKYHKLAQKIHFKKKTTFRSPFKTVSYF